MFWAEIWKIEKYQSFFLSENFQFLEVKFSIYLNRRVFVMVYKGSTMRKRVSGHLRTAKAQTSLRIRAVWSGPSLSANRILKYYRWSNGEQRHGWDLAHAQGNVNSHILRLLEGRFWFGLPVLCGNISKPCFSSVFKLKGVILCAHVG